MNIDYFNDVLGDNASVIQPEEGETFEMNGMSFSFKVTSDLSNDQLGIYTIRLAAKAVGAKLHYHRFMDEAFIIKKGILTMFYGPEGKRIEAKPGTIVYAPRMTPHAFQNDTDEAVEVDLIFNPSQKREGFFRGLSETLSEQPIDPEKYLKLYNKYDSFPVDTSNMLPVRG